MWSETISRSKPRPSTVCAQRRNVPGAVPGPKFGTFTPIRTGQDYPAAARAEPNYSGSGADTGESGTVIDPAIESHYGTGYERSRLFPDGRPSLEYVRSMELLGRLLPPPPARLLDVGGGPGAYAAALARR